MTESRTIYFDNAATTPVAPEVVEAMMPFLTEHFGNPSSTHQFGRKAKSALEMARKSIARHLGCSPMEICFTSGGTEADNMAIVGAIQELGVRRIISSPIEHHAVLHTLEHCAADFDVEVVNVRLTEQGHVDTDHLKELLSDKEKKTMVSLMHANNEIGTMIDLEQIANICAKKQVLFHSDTVQTMGHYRIDLRRTPLHFLTGSAHKFHGPKGVGFLYINKEIHIDALIRGGAQERNLRAGTENVAGIVGMSKALDIACENMDEHAEKIAHLKEYMKSALESSIPGITFHGCPERSLYTVLNVGLPPMEHPEMLLFLLDIDGIACSAGSACSSGSNQGSHVLRALHYEGEGPGVRFSFSRYNTFEEVDYVVSRLKHHLGLSANSELRKSDGVMI